MSNIARDPAAIANSTTSVTRLADAQSLLRQAELRRDDDPRATLRMLDALPTSDLRRIDPATNGRVSLLRAQLLSDQGEHEMAAGAARAARHDLLASGLTLESYRADLVLTEVFCASGDALRSIDLAESILADVGGEPASWRDCDDVALLRARVHLQLGVAHASLGQHREALGHFDAAWNGFHGLEEPAFAARTSAERATCYLGLDMTHRSLADLDRARVDLAQLGQVTAAARCVIPMSRALVRLDRIAEAIHVLEDVRPVFEQRGLILDGAALNLAMAEALVHAGLAHDARLEAQAADEIFTELNRIEGSSQARFVDGIASLAAGDDASIVLRPEITERLHGFPHHRQEVALVRLLELLRTPERQVTELGHRVSALSHASAATTGDPFMSALAELATAYTAPEGRTGQRHVDEARRLIELHDLHGLDVARAVVAARVLHRAGNAHGAAAEITTALTRASGERAHVQGHRRFLTHLQVVGIADSALLDLLLRIGTPTAMTDAWRWASVTRSRSLTDLAYTAVQRHEPGPMTPPLPVRHDVELAMLSDALDQLLEPNAAVDLSEIRATHVAVRRDIRQEIPRASLPLTAEGLVDLPSVPEGPVLQFHVREDDIIAFVIREGQVYARRLSGTVPDIVSFTSEWHAECARLQLLPELRMRPADHYSLGALSASLLSPVEDLLDDLQDFELVVVAPTLLHAVPFEALTFGARSFCDAFALRFATGLHDTDALHADGYLPERPRSSLLALMVPDESAPRIADETRALAAIHPDATILSGTDATADALGRLARDHDVVHIACHGLYWPDHPSSSGLRLGDRWVTASEILRMDLRGCLVLLNACTTGRTHDTASESIGLTQAVLAAGARGVVATTWPVDDVVALEFARRFHHHLGEGVGPADAVALACDDMRTELSGHPWAWAAHRHIASGATVLRDACGA